MWSKGAGVIYSKDHDTEPPLDHKRENTKPSVHNAKGVKGKGHYSIAKKKNLKSGNVKDLSEDTIVGRKSDMVVTISEDTIVGRTRIEEVDLHKSFVISMKETPRPTIKIPWYDNGKEKGKVAM